ncbi:MAG: hypothetical protein PHH30_00145 [Bacteroidales bacterium]|nr:hypothetical protein [Bacteroidales bacterium]
MNKIKKYLLIISLLSAAFLNAQEIDLSYDTYLVAMRDINISKNSPAILDYTFHEGDVLYLNLATKKDKTIDQITITQNSKVLFSEKDYDPTRQIEINIVETGVVEFTFSIRSFSQDIELRLMRKAEYIGGRYFNTAIELTKNYDTVIHQYEINQVVDYKEFREPSYFKIITDVDYESTQISAKKYTLKGGQKNYATITKPQDTILSDNKQMVLVGYQILITSEAGAESMWNAISTGMDVGCLALSLFVPGGAAIGLGVETMFSMVAPQEGGEPVYYLIMADKTELDKFMDNDNNTNPMVYESGLATGYSGNWSPMDVIYIGLQNLNILAEIKISVATYAVYQTTTWSQISQDIVTIKPVVEKIPMSMEVIKNEKKYVFQK